VDEVIWTIWPGLPGAAEVVRARERMAMAETADATLRIIVVE